MQDNVLGVQRDLDLRVYAVWFRMYPGDAREQWPSAILQDARVRHYWDEERTVGAWYAERSPSMKEALAPESRGVAGPVLWDAYLVYGPDSRWEEAPSGLRRWGRTILSTSDALAKAVESLAVEARTTQ